MLTSIKVTLFNLFRFSLKHYLLVMGLFLSCLLLISLKPWFDLLELQSLTLRQCYFFPYQDRSQVSPITLINVDDKTDAHPEMNQLFGRFRSREIHSYAIRFLKRANPKAVIFDMSFNGGDDPERATGDLKMVNSLKGTHQFISTLMFDTIPDPKQTWSNYPGNVQTDLLKQTLNLPKGIHYFPLLRNLSFPSLSPPFSKLLNSPMHFYSANSLKQDISGTVREWYPLSKYGNHFYPSLALGTVLNGQKQISISKEGLLTWPKGQVHLGSEGTPLIKWYGNIAFPQQNHSHIQQIYPQYSYWDILISELALECNENASLPICKKVHFTNQTLISPKLFDQQYVFIGPTYQNAGDTYTSIYPGRKYPGVYVQANQLDNLLHDDFVVSVPFWINLLITLIGISLVFWSVFRWQTIISSFCILIISCLGYFLISIQAYNHWNLWLNTVYPLGGMLLTYASGYVYRYKTEEAQKQKVRGLFSKCISPGVMHELEKNPDAVNIDHYLMREVTVLFCDIRDYSNMYDTYPPDVMDKLEKQFFSLYTDIVAQTYKGTMDKFVGDEAMTYWGFPLQTAEDPLLAVSAAIALRDAIAQWKPEAETGIPQIRIGIGINTGVAKIGSVGSDYFVDFTVKGPEVIYAARLEQLNKTHGTTILISQATYDRVKDHIAVNNLGMNKVKGHAEEVVYEVLGLKPSI